MSLKKSIAMLAIAAMPLGALYAAPKKTAKSAPKPAAAAASFKVDPKASSVKWTGKKVTGQHHGTIQIKEGELNVVNGALTGGKFVLDTTSIDDEDLGPDMKPKLVGHLKSDAFFNVEKYPTALFVITSIAPLANGADGATHTVSGDLTIKDITKPLSFPAKIAVGADTVTADAKNIAVDRTIYDIRYGSGKFFQGLGDKVISDQFWLDVSLVAKK
jgi:polyisoprenoid-binding protein YceI